MIVGSVLLPTLRRQAEGKRGSPHCRSRPQRGSSDPMYPEAVRRTISGSASPERAKCITSTVSAHVLQSLVILSTVSGGQLYRSIKTCRRPKGAHPSETRVRKEYPSSATNDLPAIVRMLTHGSSNHHRVPSVGAEPIRRVGQLSRESHDPRHIWIDRGEQRDEPRHVAGPMRSDHELPGLGLEVK
jgi:hypothetical protein